MDIEELWFTSEGIQCRAWLYRPPSAGPHPLVVLAHGLSGTHTLYWRVAEAFAAAGLAVLDFDNRFVGASEGEPRQTISLEVQLEDLRNAVGVGRSLPGIDPDRIALYGSSFGGGLAIDVAAKDPRLGAVVLVVPLVDGFTNLPGAGSEFRNEASIWETFTAVFFRPGRHLKQVSCPVLMLSGDKDSVCPPGPQRKAARDLTNVTLETGPFDHFDPFLRQFDELIKSQIAFLHEHLKKVA